MSRFFPKNLFRIENCLSFLSDLRISEQLTIKLSIYKNSSHCIYLSLDNGVTMISFIIANKFTVSKENVVVGAPPRYKIFQKIQVLLQECTDFKALLIQDGCQPYRNNLCLDDLGQFRYFKIQL